MDGKLAICLPGAFLWHLYCVVDIRHLVDCINLKFWGKDLLLSLQSLSTRIWLHRKEQGTTFYVSNFFKNMAFKWGFNQLYHHTALTFNDTCTEWLVIDSKVIKLPGACCCLARLSIYQGHQRWSNTEYWKFFQSGMD